MMNTPLRVAVLLLCSCSALRADLDIEEITPDKAEQLGWTITVRETEKYVAFPEPPAALISQGRTAHLSVRHNRKLVVSCLLGLHERRSGDRYELAVARQYLQNSRFELSRAAASRDGESYRIHLHKFLELTTTKTRS